MGQMDLSLVLHGEWRGVAGLSFSDKVVLVTGASSGIGLETARLFIEQGATVYLNGRDDQKLGRAAGELGGLPGKAVTLPGDVSQVKQCEAMLAFVAEQGSGLDILVNSAGVWVEGKTDTMTEEDWDSVMNINAKGTFFMCRYAIPLLEKSSGVIVNVSSDSGLVGNNEASAYCASKGAVTLMTKAMAVELAARGIRVNAVCPGDVETPMLEKACRDYGDGDREAYYNSLLAHYPRGEKGRFTQPQEVAEAILFLASPKVQAITGACLSIDFGITAGY
jgi:NAD(P)-dependent dehydrogenase (short-subunit alcohol dehydrogenase family)